MRFARQYDSYDLPILSLFLMLKEAFTDFSTGNLAKAESACGATHWRGRAGRTGWPAWDRRGSPGGRPPCIADGKPYPRFTFAARGVMRQNSHLPTDQLDDGTPDRRTYQDIGQDRYDAVRCRRKGLCRKWVSQGWGRKLGGSVVGRSRPTDQAASVSLRCLQERRSWYV
jgi:hypothetical protein